MSEFNHEEELFDAARKLSDPRERERFLDERCAGDGPLRQRLAQLLAALQESDDYFRPVLPASAMQHRSTTFTSEREVIGTRIGRYEVLEKIGEGGFGMVYVAEQAEPVKRRVALKVIKLGMDTRQVVARLEAERQALALMDHPNIAKVLDGGETENGRPYFVMDLVEGLPITQFCDEAKRSTRERLELFLEVCSAIQHAHQKGIIHRDIKPSNILVTWQGDKPVPKVIDFGIAKALQEPLTDKTLVTQFQQFIGTPAYMSPEQASSSGLAVDTRSDIYALGVLLYELLTGTTPFDAKELVKPGLDEMRRTICEQDPPRPSTRLRALVEDQLTTTARCRGIEGPRLVAALRGDLDWIVMKCLEKDPARRYESANALGQDLRRHLTNEPVQARPPGALYRLQKAIRRNRLAFTAGTIVLAAIITGVSISFVSLLHARTAVREQERLRQETRRAEREKAEEVWRSHFATALARRRSGGPGQRFATINAVSNAAAMRPSLELRNEAIAALALVDLGPPRFGSDTPWTNNYPQELGVAFDRDLRRVALVAQDSSIYIRRVADDSELVHLPASAPGPGVNARLLFSPDDRFLAARYRSGEVLCWQLEPLRLCLSVKHSANLADSVQFTPDSHSLAVGDSGRRLHRYDLPALPEQSLRDNVEPPTSHVASTIELPVRPVYLALDPIGNAFAVSGGTDLQLWRWPEPQLMRDVLPPAECYQLLWHPENGELLIGRNGGVERLDPASGGVIALHGHNGAVSQMALHPRGDLLATHSWDNRTKLWDLEIEMPLLSTDSGFALQFSRDGRELGFRHSTSRYGVWPVVISRVFRTLARRPTPRQFGSVDFTADGRMMILVDDFGLAWVDLWEGHYEQRTVPGLTDARFSGDGTALLLAGNDGFKRWPLQKRHDAQASGLQFLGEPETVGTNRFPLTSPIVFSADRAVVVAGEQGSKYGHSRVLITDERGTQRVLQSPDAAKAATFALSPDGRWLALSHWIGATYLLDAQTGETKKVWPELQFAGLAFTPDGRSLVTGTGQEYRFWEVGSWKPGLRIDRETGGLVRGLIVFSADGQLMAVVKGFDMVELLDWRTGEILADLVPPRPQYINALAFSPDGSVLVVVGQEAVHLWDLRELRRELVTLKLDWKQPPFPASTHPLGDVVFRPRHPASN